MISGTHGVLVLDKPQGITSRAAVDHALRWFPRGTRLGHTGTLDPLATGVLVLCVGNATRFTEYVQQMKKVYLTTIRLGCRSTTDDAEGEITEEHFVEPPSPSQIQAAVESYVGTIDQIPPDFSAAHVTGRRAYDLARRGHEVRLSPRRVQIDAIRILEQQFPTLRLEVTCGKGTYIRSLARDLGETLQCGGLVETLRRVRVGPFTPREAVPWDASTEAVSSFLQPVSACLTALPRLELDEESARRLGLGQKLPLTDQVPSCESAAFDPAGRLVGVVRGDQAKGVLRPVRILSQDARGDTHD